MMITEKAEQKKSIPRMDKLIQIKLKNRINKDKQTEAELTRKLQPEPPKRLIPQPLPLRTQNRCQHFPPLEHRLETHDDVVCDLFNFN